MIRQGNACRYNVCAYTCRAQSPDKRSGATAPRSLTSGTTRDCAAQLRYCAGRETALYIYTMNNPSYSWTTDSECHAWDPTMYRVIRVHLLVLYWSLHNYINIPSSSSPSSSSSWSPTWSAFATAPWQLFDKAALSHSTIDVTSWLVNAFTFSIASWVFVSKTCDSGVICLQFLLFSPTLVYNNCQSHVCTRTCWQLPEGYCHNYGDWFKIGSHL